MRFALNCRGSASAINFDALIKRNRFEPRRDRMKRSERGMTRTCVREPRATGGIEFPNLIALCRAERRREKGRKRERRCVYICERHRHEEWVHKQVHWMALDHKYESWFDYMRRGGETSMSNQPSTRPFPSPIHHHSYTFRLYRYSRLYMSHATADAAAFYSLLLFYFNRGEIPRLVYRSPIVFACTSFPITYIQND